MDRSWRRGGGASGGGSQRSQTKLQLSEKKRKQEKQHCSKCPPPHLLCRSFEARCRIMIIIVDICATNKTFRLISSSHVNLAFGGVFAVTCSLMVRWVDLGIFAVKGLNAADQSFLKKKDVHFGVCSKIRAICPPSVRFKTNKQKN